MQKRIYAIILAALCLAAFIWTPTIAVRRAQAASLSPTASLVPANLQQTDKLTAQPRALSGYYGTTVAVDGDTLVVGEPLNGNGAVHIYKRTGTSFGLQQKLTVNSQEQFGTAVAVQGDTLLVGARDADGARGAAYVYVRTNLTWVLQQRLTAGDRATGDYFGTAVALQGDAALIGASLNDIGAHLAQGSAYVFTRFNGVWTQKQQLTAGDGAAGDRLGTSVAISGNTCLLGAPNADVNDMEDQGAAYVFVLSHNVWAQQQKLVAGDGAMNHLFGGAVAVRGDLAVAGAEGHNVQRGAVYSFTRSGSSWSQQEKLLANDGASFEQFGSALALGEDGASLAIAAQADDGATVNEGSVYLFTLSNGSWNQQQKLKAADAKENDYFGAAVSLSGTTLVSGADNEENKGAAYIFQPPFNAPPVLTPLPLTRMAGIQLAAPAAIAGVSDLEDPESALQVKVNNGVSATVNGVTLSGLSVTPAGQVMGLLFTARAATTASFTLQTTDSGGATATATLIVTVTPNQPPVLTYNTPPDVPAGSSLTINPSGGPMSIPAITTIAVQSVTPPVSGSLAVNAQGVISLANIGAPGSHLVTIRAMNACGTFTDATFTLNVACPAVSLSPAALPNGAVSQAYNAGFSAQGGDAPHTFALYTGALPNGLTLAPNGMLTGLPTQVGVFNFEIQATSSNGCIGKQSYTVTINGGTNPGLQFYPLPSPLRLLDTRAGQSGCDAPGAPISGGTSRTQPARRTCDGVTIPANALAVTGNVTTVQSGGGYLTLYPSDAQQPLVANTNYAPNEVINNVFTVGLGNADGSFKIFATTDTHVVVDITGYYALPSANGLYFHPLPKPVRLLDTRAGFTGCFTPGAPLLAKADQTQFATGTCQGVMIPATALALVGNATTVGPQAPGYLTFYPANAPRPLAASSNFVAGQIINAPFTVGLSPSGAFNVFTTSQTDLVIDVTGYYSIDAQDVTGAGLLFNPLPSPVRLLETRAGLTGCYTPGAPLAAGSTRQQQARGACGGQTIAANALAIVGNATVVNNQAGYLTFWPQGAAQPLVSSSNFAAGQVLNRHFTVGLGATGMFNIFASAQTDLIVDVSGFFAP